MPKPDVPRVRPVSYCATGRVPGEIQRAFAVLTDPARMPQWLPGCGAAVSDDPIAPGVHIRVRFRSRVTDFEVIDHAPPHRYGWAERGQRTGWRVWFRLDGAAPGETALTVCEVWTPASLGARLWGHLIRRRRPERHVAQILDRLRHILS